MKKIISIIFVSALIIQLTACSSSQKTEAPAESSSAWSSTIDVISDKHTEKEDETIVSVETEKTEQSVQAETPETTPTLKAEVDKQKPTTDEKQIVETESKPQETESTAAETTKEKEPTVEKQPESVKPKIPSTSEVEQRVAEYINKYRQSQGDTSAIVLSGLTQVARYRAKQLITNFAHVSNRSVCGELKYGRYVDLTEYGLPESDNYYEGYDREAICKGDWSGTAEQIANNIATGFKNSSQHWNYVGDSAYGYMAVGIVYNEANQTWYCCICVSMENYGG